MSAPTTLTWSPTVFADAARACDAHTFDGAWNPGDVEVMRTAIHAAVWALGSAEPDEVKRLTTAILWPRASWPITAVPRRERAEMVRLFGPDAETPPPGSRGWVEELRLLYAHRILIVSGGRYSVSYAPYDPEMKARALVAAAWLKRGAS